MEWGDHKSTSRFNSRSTPLNIFLNDIFLFISKCQLCNYADGNTLYKSWKNMRKIKNDLEMGFMILHKRFHENHNVTILSTVMMTLPTK